MKEPGLQEAKSGLRGCWQPATIQFQIVGLKGLYLLKYFFFYFLKLNCNYCTINFALNTVIVGLLVLILKSEVVAFKSAYSQTEWEANRAWRPEPWALGPHTGSWNALAPRKGNPLPSLRSCFLGYKNRNNNSKDCWGLNKTIGVTCPRWLKWKRKVFKSDKHWTFIELSHLVIWTHKVQNTSFLVRCYSWILQSVR